MYFLIYKASADTHVYKLIYDILHCYYIDTIVIMYHQLYIAFHI